MSRGGGEVTCDYRLLWEGEHRYNYTRSFPAGSYNVYAALSSDTPGDHVGGALTNVIRGADTLLGVFSGDGGWGNSSLTPMKDAARTNS